MDGIPPKCWVWIVGLEKRLSEEGVKQRGRAEKEERQGAKATQYSLPAGQAHRRRMGCSFHIPVMSSSARWITE